MVMGQKRARIVAFCLEFRHFMGKERRKKKEKGHESHEIIKT